MVDTISTDADLLSNQFEDGQSDTITAAKVRNLIVSKPNVLDLYDDSANASGLGAPAILRGTVYAHKASGVTVGGGNSQAVQTATAAGLQAALNYAAANGKFFEIIPGVYEIYSSTGLQIPTTANGFTWRGATGGGNGADGGSEIVQYYLAGTGAPVLTIGDSTGATLVRGVDFDGASVRYGGAAATLTSAETVVVGSLFLSNVDNVYVQHGGSWSSGNPAGNSGYRGVNLKGGANGIFSCSFRNWSVWGAGCQDLVAGSNLFTGNVFHNWYLNTGSGMSQAAINGNYLNLSQCHECNFTELNCEWGSANRILSVDSCSGLDIRTFHCEGVGLTGYSPMVMWLNGSMVNISNFHCVDLTLTTAGVTSTLGNIIGTTAGNPSLVKIVNFSLVYNNANLLQKLLVMYGYQPYNNQPGSGSLYGYCTIENGNVGTGGTSAQTIGNFNVDENMPTGPSQFLVPGYFNRYSYGFQGSRLEGMQINVSANYSHYGMLKDTQILIPVSSLAANITITLAATMGVTGNQPPDAGTRVHIMRGDGSSYTVAVVDGSNSNAVLSSNVVASTDQHYRFDGTHWVSFSPVTASASLT